MSSTNIYIPSFDQTQDLIWHDYVYEPMSKEDILKEQDTKVGGWFGWRNGMYGRTTSDKQKVAVSKAMKGKKKWYKIECNWKAMHGKDNPRAQSCIIDGAEYETVTKAAEATGIHRTTISHRCKSDNPKFTSYLYK